MFSRSGDILCCCWMLSPPQDSEDHGEGPGRRCHISRSQHSPTHSPRQSKIAHSASMRSFLSQSFWDSSQLPTHHKSCLFLPLFPAFTNQSCKSLPDSSFSPSVTSKPPGSSPLPSHAHLWCCHFSPTNTHMRTQTQDLQTPLSRSLYLTFSFPSPCLVSNPTQLFSQPQHHVPA